MTKSYSPLNIVALKPDVTYYQYQEAPELVHWNDPALQAMIDFRFTKAATVNPEESIDIALLNVKNSTSHVLLVINREQQILGLIDAEDLMGEKPVRAIQERRLARADVTVRMVMTPKSEVVALDFEQLRHAKVGHIVQTLHAHKHHYALVVKIDETTGAQVIRGLFSTSQLSKQLGQDVSSAPPEALSLAELQHGLHLSD